MCRPRIQSSFFWRQRFRFPPITKQIFFYNRDQARVSCWWVVTINPTRPTILESDSAVLAVITNGYPTHHATSAKEPACDHRPNSVSRDWQRFRTNPSSMTMLGASLCSCLLLLTTNKPQRLICESERGTAKVISLYFEVRAEKDIIVHSC